MRVIVLITFLALVNVSQAAYATNTNAFYNNLNTCVTKTNSDIDCVTEVKNGLRKMSHYIQDIRNLKNNMKKISDGFNTLKAITSITKYIPKVGTAINVLHNVIKAAKPSFDSAYNKVKAVDAKVYPYKPKADAGVKKCETGIQWLNIIKKKCTDGRTGVGAARSCVNAMSGNLKTTLGSKLEDFGGALNPSASQMVRALGNIGSACSAVKRISDIALGWPDIGPIIRGIDDVYDALKPILDFFAKINKALRERLCIPNPLEALAEWEIVEEIAESPVNPGNWGWGRRRRSLKIEEGTSSTALIRISEQEANTYLSRSKRASSACFSVKDILDGIDSIFAPLVNLANKAIAAVLKFLPSFKLPGFPNYSNIFIINFNFDLPTVDFGLDLNFFFGFNYIKWDCSTQVKNVCRAGTGAVSFNCAKSMASYRPTSGSVVGRKKREISDASLSTEILDDEFTIQEDQEYTADNTTDSSSLPHTHLTDSGDIMVDIEIPDSMRPPRKDDKQLTSDEIEEKMQHLTAEQRYRLRIRLEKKQSAKGGDDATNSSSDPKKRDAELIQLMKDLQETLRQN